MLQVCASLCRILQHLILFYCSIYAIYFIRADGRLKYWTLSPLKIRPYLAMAIDPVTLMLRFFVSLSKSSMRP